MNRSILNVLFVISLLIPAIGRPQHAPDAQAKEVVMQYLENELDRGQREKGYWEMRWKTKLPASKSSLSLGAAYVRYRLPDDQIERFIESGDLLHSATMLSVCFPVFNGSELIAAVELQDRGGEWAWYGTSNPAGSADSLAIAFQQVGSAVSLIGADHLGAFLVFTPLGNSEMRVYPLQADSRGFLQDKLDARGTLSYSGAMAALRPVAIERLNYRNQLKQNDR